MGTRSARAAFSHHFPWSLQPTSCQRMACLLTESTSDRRHVVCDADQVVQDWKKKTKNDAATRLATVLHKVQKQSAQRSCNCTADYAQDGRCIPAEHLVLQHVAHSLCTAGAWLLMSCYVSACRPSLMRQVFAAMWMPQGSMVASVSGHDDVTG